MGIPRLALCLVLAALYAPGCTDASSPSAAISSPTRSPIATPAPCAETAVRSVMESFVDAFDRGDDPARFFAPAATGQYAQAEQVAATAFNWYSLSDGRSPGVAFMERTGLAPYFARRHAAGERWTLDLVNFNLFAPYPRADFGFGITRTANDLVASTAGPHENAKGMLNCDTKKIVTWTM